MAEPQSILRIRLQDRTVTFQIEGSGRMTHGVPLRCLAESALASGATALRLDLSRCTHRDSTFLGTLLGIKRIVEQRGPATSFALVDPSPRCRAVLQLMGVEGYLSLVTEEGTAGGTWIELPGGIQDVEAFKRNVVEAHEELAGLAGPAGDPFRDAMKELQSNKERQGFVTP